MNNIAVIGLGVMGQSIALNILNHGYSVSVYNRSYEKTMDFMKRVKDNCTPTKTLAELVASLEKPRKILLMVPAGKPVDDVIESLLPHLETGDIVMDGGNSFYRDSMKRSDYLETKGLHFLGIGISGGEKGALEGPSIMPSGNSTIYQQVAPILEAIAAKKDNKACVSYIGEKGSGHYVKMVHNGIEYADIQLISETYDLLRFGLNKSVEEVQAIFEKWNQGKLKSYLIEITANILKVKENDEYLVDKILDVAKEKGTGRWTSMESFELGISVPTITEAVYARYLSGKKVERVKASKLLSYEPIEANISVEAIEQALYLAKISCYAQGFDLLKQASVKYNWQLDFSEIALIWREGCIIRADFLDDIASAFKHSDESLLIANANELIKHQADLRNTIIYAVSTGIAIPALMSTLAYYDGYRRANSPANLVQAQRDYFGAHTYERIDQIGSYHTEWES